jgi:hypothetical protein
MKGADLKDLVHGAQPYTAFPFSKTSLVSYDLQKFYVNGPSV